MHSKRSWFVLSFVILSLVIAVPSEARKKREPKPPPMDIEDGALDEIHLETATLPHDVPIVFRKFSTENTDFGTGDEGGKESRVAAAETMRTLAPDVMAEGFERELRKAGLFGPVEIVDGADGEVPEGALVLEGEFLLINPGSRAKRYFVGYGAGSSGVGVAGRVMDSDGQILARFAHRKHSGIGIGGGNYVKFMSDDARDVGEDVARFLVIWSRGGDLTDD